MSDDGSRRDFALDAADRAANAASSLPCAGLPIRGAWLVGVGASGGVEFAAAYVRQHPGLPAEKLYYALRRRDVDWGDLGAKARVGIEVFRATLLICDELFAAERGERRR